MLKRENSKNLFLDNQCDSKQAIKFQKSSHSDELGLSKNSILQVFYNIFILELPLFHLDSFTLQKQHFL